jgi:TolB-like protein/class 3 adenylate cyclase
MAEGIQRRLAAIVSADVVGYSRLMGVDETGTLAALRAHRAELIDAKIAEHGGRIVKTMGDGLLLEFPSVVDATQCVIEVQKGMAERNQGVDEDRRITFRVGINLGDIIIEGEDILGDGVNIAARLQEIAEPGGVAVSGRVHEDVQDRLDDKFADAGEKELKNIARPVRVWRWTQDIIAVSVPPTAEVLPLPDKPSIAVLPFDNMSGDPEQEYFSDGVTEDIITALSKFRWFFVTARNSTFVYKDTAIDIKQVGRELGVRYVLEGSVRKAGSRIRITAQLIEAESGNHIWAERYDRELVDIFELQDEITQTIAAAVEPELAGSERERVLHKPTENMQAWDLYQRGLSKIMQLDETSMADGADFMRQSISRDPNFGPAYAYLAFVDYWDVTLSRRGEREETLQRGLAHARQALLIDQRDYVAHWALGRLHNMDGDHQSAIRELEISVAINPSFAHGYYGLAVVHTFADNPEKALEYADIGIRLSPNDPLRWTVIGHKGMAYALLGEMGPAIDFVEQSCRFPNVQYIPVALLASFYAVANRPEDAAATLEWARRLEPNLSMKQVEDYLGQADNDVFGEFIDALRKAGLN